MVSHRWPTRAEVADVANAVLDGTDAVMLSAETAIGQYPVEAIRMLRSVITATEAVYPFETVLDTRTQKPQPSQEDSISRSACRLAFDAEAKAIVISSSSASLPYSVSRFRPPMPIILLSGDRLFIQQLALSWGVQPAFAASHAAATLEPARRWLIDNGLARAGNSVVWIHSSDTKKKFGGYSIQLVQL
jgi:pyruvate kinase